MLLGAGTEVMLSDRAAERLVVVHWPIVIGNMAMMAQAKTMEAKIMGNYE